MGQWPRLTSDMVKRSYKNGCLKDGQRIRYQDRKKSPAIANLVTRRITVPAKISTLDQETMQKVNVVKF